MKSRDFIYWLQGFFELHSAGPKRGEPHDDNTLSGYQVEMIRNHLAMVFKHDIDPAAGDSKVQDTLNALHNKPQTNKTPSNPVPSGDVLYRC